MSHKQRPFTRKQRSRILKQRRIAERKEARADKAEAKEYQRTLGIFNKCDPERTERLADGR